MAIPTPVFSYSPIAYFAYICKTMNKELITNELLALVAQEEPYLRSLPEEVITEHLHLGQIHELAK